MPGGDKIRRDIQNAISYHQTGEFEKAKTIYKNVLKSTPAHFDASNLLGVLYVQEGDARKGIKHLNDALRINPDAAIAHYNKGEALGHLNDYERALNYFKKALELDPNYYEAAYKIGLSLHHLKRYEDATAGFQNAIHINPGVFIAHHSMADSLRELDRNSEAINFYEKAIQLNPQSALSYNNRAIAYKKIAQFHQSEADYKKAISIDPSNSLYHYNLANLYKDRENYARAIELYKTALKFNPDFTDALFGLAISFQRLENWQTAMKIYGQVIALDPSNYEANLNYAEVLYELRQLQNSLKQVERAIELKPKEVKGYNFRAKILNTMGLYNESIIDCERSIAINPELAESYTNRGLNYFDLEEFDKAESDFNFAIKLDENFTPGLYNKSILLLRKKLFSDGFNLYNSRWKRKDLSWVPLATTIPHWNIGSEARRILVWSEQGIGDEIFYSSLLSLIPKHIEINLCADKRLHSIYKRSFPDVILHDRADQNSLGSGDFDAQLAIGDLGSALNVDFDKIIARKYPFLVPNEIKKKEFNNQNLTSNARILCGLAWKSKNRKVGYEKSIKLTNLSPLLSMRDIAFVNLQYGEVAEEIEVAEHKLGIKINQIEGLDCYNDIDGLLSLVSVCDVIVTTSNITAHLAGALGKTAIVIVPSGKGHIWYWHDDEESIWYPSLKVRFSKSNSGWDDVSNDILETFKELT